MIATQGMHTSAALKCFVDTYHSQMFAGVRLYCVSVTSGTQRTFSLTLCISVLACLGSQAFLKVQHTWICIDILCSFDSFGCQFSKFFLPLMEALCLQIALQHAHM